MTMRYLAIKYKNNVEDVVPAPMLDRLIASGSIIQFFRPADQKWILLGKDKIRGMGGSYEGTERRWVAPPAAMIKVDPQVPTTP